MSCHELPKYCFPGSATSPTASLPQAWMDESKDLDPGWFWVGYLSYSLVSNLQ